MTPTEEAAALLVQWAKESEVELDVVDVGHLVVTLPGEKKLKTTVSVLFSKHRVDMQAFLMRRPDENHAAFYRWMLRRNQILHNVSFFLDPHGDVYLRASVPAAAWTPEIIDQVMGEILTVSDGSFNDLLIHGFLTSMKREWAWRIARGESTRNLAAFEHLLDTEDNEFIGSFSETAPETRADEPSAD